jgi:hypothetical protein
MAELRRLTKAEIAQVEILAGAIAGTIDKVSANIDIENFGVVSSAIMIILAALVCECLDAEDHETAIEIMLKSMREAVLTGECPIIVN